MKNETMYDAISEIREDFIEEAENYKFKKKTSSRLMKWGSMAACFCLVVLGAGLFMSGALAQKGAKVEQNGNMTGKTSSSAPGENPVASGLLTVLAYNGAFYNVSNELLVLNAAGIDNTITSADCGLFLGNLALTENGYEETVYDTDIELYQYAQAYSNTAVYVIRDGEEYMAGLFSNNFTVGNADDYSPVSELLRRYGIEEAAQLASVGEVNGTVTGGTVVGNITETAALEAFYEAVMTMETGCYGREEFRALMLEVMTEDEFMRLLEAERLLCIETAEGLKFYISWYPELGWLYSGGTTAYYMITEEMQAWLDAYMTK